MTEHVVDNKQNRTVIGQIQPCPQVDRQWREQGWSLPAANIASRAFAAAGRVGTRDVIDERTAADIAAKASAAVGPLPDIVQRHNQQIREILDELKQQQREIDRLRYMLRASTETDRRPSGDVVPSLTPECASVVLKPVPTEDDVVCEADTDNIAAAFAHPQGGDGKY